MDTNNTHHMSQTLGLPLNKWSGNTPHLECYFNPESPGWHQSLHQLRPIIHCFTILLWGVEIVMHQVYSSQEFFVWGEGGGGYENIQ